VTDLPALDDAVLDELRASVGGDEAFVADLAATYAGEGAEQIALIEAAAAARDTDAIVRPAHSLKSASASLGAARMSNVARELELAGREGRSSEIGGLVEAARSAWNETVAALRDRGLIG
jgi:HPt (histidine-containing phosphotransfer) domain-containing protein